MGRKAARISKDELAGMILTQKEAIGEEEYYYITELTPQIQKDLSKVEFDLENVMEGPPEPRLDYTRYQGFHTLDNGLQQVELTKDAEDEWLALLMTGGGRMLGSPDCTPGYYNNEGQDPGPAARYNVGYPQGASAFFEYLKGWRDNGEFEGLEFR